MSDREMLVNERCQVRADEGRFYGYQMRWPQRAAHWYAMREAANFVLSVLRTGLAGAPVSALLPALVERGGREECQEARDYIGAVVERLQLQGGKQ